MPIEMPEEYAFGGSPLVECRCSTQREWDTCSIRSGSAGCTRDSASTGRTYCLPEFGCQCGNYDQGDQVGRSTPSNVLEEANLAIERGRAYGRVTDDFTRITGAAAALGLDSNDPEHHPLYMILLKISRLVGSPGHRDSIVDIAGYARTLELLLEGK